jgi:hypothetical protein
VAAIHWKSTRTFNKSYKNVSANNITDGNDAHVESRIVNVGSVCYYSFRKISD